MTEQNEFGIESLTGRVDVIDGAIDAVGKMHTKTDDDYTHVLDKLSAMREKVNKLLKRQDDVEDEYKNIDKLIFSSKPGDYDVHMYNAPERTVNVAGTPAVRAPEPQLVIDPAPPPQKPSKELSEKLSASEKETAKGSTEETHAMGNAAKEAPA